MPSMCASRQRDALSVIERYGHGGLSVPARLMVPLRRETTAATGFRPSSYYFETLPTYRDAGTWFSPETR